jgi:hypothetical protein
MQEKRGKKRKGEKQGKKLLQLLYWEPIRNLEGTPWEHIGKQGKMKKKILLAPQT